MSSNNKDLRRLNRAELLEILIRKTEENDALLLRIENLEEQLRDKRLCIKNAGTLSEAALALSGVFEAADNAVKIYMDEIMRMSSERDAIINKANIKAGEIIKNAEEKACKIISDARIEQEKKTEFAVEQVDIKNENETNATPAGNKCTEPEGGTEQGTL